MVAIPDGTYIADFNFWDNDVTTPEKPRIWLRWTIAEGQYTGENVTCSFWDRDLQGRDTSFFAEMARIRGNPWSIKRTIKEIASLSLLDALIGRYEIETRQAPNRQRVYHSNVTRVIKFVGRAYVEYQNESITRDQYEGPQDDAPNNNDQSWLIQVSLFHLRSYNFFRELRRFAQHGHNESALQAQADELKKHIDTLVNHSHLKGTY